MLLSLQESAVPTALCKRFLSGREPSTFQFARDLATARPTKGEFFSMPELRPTQALGGGSREGPTKEMPDLHASRVSCSPTVGEI